MRAAIRLLGLISLIAGQLILLPSFAHAQSIKDPIHLILFDYSGRSPHLNDVRAKLKDILDPVENITGRKSNLGIGRVDLNNDGTYEIAVQMAEEGFFCDRKGTCPTYIFAITTDGLVTLAKFEMQALYVSDVTNKDIRDLRIYSDFRSHKYAIYKWDGSVYKLSGGNTYATAPKTLFY